MSGFEKEEIRNRAKGMSREEQELFCKCFPADVLLDEIGRRYNEQIGMISQVRTILRVEEEPAGYKVPMLNF